MTTLTNTETIITVTPEMIANNTAPVLSFGKYIPGETVQVCCKPERHFTPDEVRAEYPAYCFDEDDNPLPDDKICTVFPASNYIIDTPGDMNIWERIASSGATV